MILEELEDFVKTFDNNDTNVQKLEKICEFLSNRNFDYDDNLFNNILKIKKIEYIINYILKRNMKAINMENIFELSTNNLFVALMIKYCTLHGIKINVDSINMENSYVDDGDIEIDTYNPLKIYLSSLNQKLLTVEEERSLGYRILNGDIIARNILIERNLRLVVSVVLKMKNSSVSTMDMISHGNLGLIMAASNYDVRTGFRFSTYAIPCIKQKIKRGIINSNKAIRLPEYMVEIEYKYQSLKTSLENEYMREVTFKDLSLITGLSIDEISKFRLLMGDIISLNQKVNEDDDELIDYISTLDKPIYELVEQKQRNETIWELLSCLNEREKFILICYYFKNYSLSKISKLLNISVERVRQIEVVAIKKIRENQTVYKLVNYMSSPNEAMKNIDIYLEKYHNSIIIKEKYFKEPSKKSKSINNYNILLQKISSCLDNALAKIGDEKRYSKK